MYHIIGSDGKEYGPISAEQLRRWLAEGRVNAQTKARPADAANWQTLGTLPEFAAALVSPPPVNPSSAPFLDQPQKTSGLAIASLVLGILGLFCFGLTAVVGLVLGIVALVKINKSQGRLAGKGIAIAGIATSGAFLLMLPLFAAMLLPALAKAKEKAQAINCVNNVKQLSLAVRLYAMDSNDKFPSATNWCDLILTNVGSATVFVCPLGSNPRCGYAYNSKLDGLKDGEINPQTVLFFESNTGWNASGGPELFSAHKHSRTKIVIGYADGSVVMLPVSQFDTLRWEP